MLATNIIIFEDENGLGVSVGSEKVYITADIGDRLGYDFKKLKHKVRCLEAENARLSLKVAEINTEGKLNELKLSLIESVLAED